MFKLDYTEILHAFTEYCVCNMADAVLNATTRTDERMELFIGIIASDQLDKGQIVRDYTAAIIEGNTVNVHNHFKTRLIEWIMNGDVNVSRIDTLTRLSTYVTLKHDAMML